MLQRATIWVLIITCVARCSGQPEIQSDPSFEIINEIGESVIVLRGLNQTALARLRKSEPSQVELGAILKLRVHSSNEAEYPISGEYRFSEGRIEFRPKFPLQHGVEYRAEHEEYYKLFMIADEAESDPTFVSEIYPTSEVLPANLLKFYITFSAPMSRGFGYAYLRLVNEDGTEVVDPFPSIGVELWDAEQRQFTLLLDPGRIKRGIAINESMGPPLVPGRRYRLVIDAEWPDATGSILAESFEKVFRVAESDHAVPDFKEWLIELPAANSSDPVFVTFSEPMDYSLADRFVWIEDENGEIIDGTSSLSDRETRWSFTRSTGDWLAGDYSIGIHSRFEDLAGNQIEKPFEVDLESGPSRIAQIETHVLPFTIRER